MYSDVTLQVKLLVKLLVTFFTLKQTLLRLVHLVVYFTHVANHSTPCLKGQTAANAVVKTSLKIHQMHIKHYKN